MVMKMPELSNDAKKMRDSIENIIHSAYDDESILTKLERDLSNIMDKQKNSSSNVENLDIKKIESADNFLKIINEIKKQRNELGPLKEELLKVYESMSNMHKIPHIENVFNSEIKSLKS